MQRVLRSRPPQVLRAQCAPRSAQPADDSLGRRFRVPRGVQGLLLRGPGCAMPPGRHEAVFRLGAEAVESWLSPSRGIAEIEVTRDDGRVVANWSLTARDLPPGGAERELTLPFELRDTAFNSELRVRSLGVAPLVASLPVAVHEGVAARPEADCATARPRHCSGSRSDGALSVQRVIGWPARRILDPRLEGLRNHTHWIADRVVGDRVDARARELSARIDGLAARRHAPGGRLHPERSLDGTSIRAQCPGRV